MHGFEFIYIREILFEIVIFLLKTRINYFLKAKTNCQHGWTGILKGNDFLMFNLVIGKFFSLHIKLWLCDSMVSIIIS